MDQFEEFVILKSISIFAPIEKKSFWASMNKILWNQHMKTASRFHFSTIRFDRKVSAWCWCESLERNSWYFYFGGVSFSQRHPWVTIVYKIPLRNNEKLHFLLPSQSADLHVWFRRVLQLSFRSFWQTTSSNQNQTSNPLFVQVRFKPLHYWQ